MISRVADRRRHHAFSDREGDPHSPWLYGTSTAAPARGFLHAHVGRLLSRELTDVRRFAPDLLADPGRRRVDSAFLPLSALSLLVPAAPGGLLTVSWWGRGRLDTSARPIWIFERLGWVHDVRRPRPRRPARLSAAPSGRAR